jgi:hypothetical protein
MAVSPPKAMEFTSKALKQGEAVLPLRQASQVSGAR